MFREIPPAGNPISLRRDERQPIFPGYDAFWMQSGTAALACAFEIARRRRPDIRQPTAVIPAYGCPDMVAAARFAGLRARLVDVGEADPGYQLDRLAAALDESVVAVTAVNFLGIAERLAEIKAILTRAGGILLIEDNAQWYPEAADRPLAGDLVVLSFGRGKPVTLLGGGALLASRDLQVTLSSIDESRATRPMASGLLARKATIYNALLNPHLYWLSRCNPFLRIGQTKYVALDKLESMDQWRREHLMENASVHLARNRDRESWISSQLSKSPLVGRVIDLPKCVSPERRGRLLRYPVLFRSPALRDAVLSEMRAKRLGASALYEQALVDIAGVAADVQSDGEPASARRFAKRLITLPCHDYVLERDVAAFGSILARVARNT